MFAATPCSDTKECRCCHESLALERFTRLSSSPDGLSYYCRACVSAKNRAYREANAEKLKAQQLEYRKANREQLAERAREYRRENPEKVRATEDGRRERRKAYKREYQERYRQENPEKVTAAIAAWRASNPAQVRTTNQTSRARARGALLDGVPVTLASVEGRWSMWGNRCWVCRGAADSTDHVKPLAAGGPHIPANLRPICRSCNSTKNAQWPYTPPVETSSAHQLNTQKAI